MIADEHRDSVDELGPESARSIDIDHSLAIPFGYVVKPKAAPGPVAAILHIFYEDLAVDLRATAAVVPTKAAQWAIVGVVAAAIAGLAIWFPLPK